MKKRSELIFSLALVPVDYIMMVAGFVAAYFYRLGSDKPLAYNVGGHVYLRYLLILLPIWVIIFALLGLYSLESTRRRIDELVKVVLACACGAMALIVLDFLNPKPILPAKSIIIYGFVFTVVFVSVARLIVSIVQRILFRYNIGVHQTLVIAPKKVVDDLGRNLGPGYHIVNDDLGASDVRGLSVTDLESLFKSHQIDEVIQLSGSNDKDVPLIGLCQQNNVAYRFVPSIMGIYNSNVQTALYGGLPVLEIRPTPLEGWGRIFKRVVDFITSLLALIILAPFFLAMAVIIKIVDPGPVFYKDERLSKTGKKIKIYKFRSMKAIYCDGGKFSTKSREEIIAEFGDPDLVEEFRKYQKVKKDPRVSSIGRFIRKTSIDELPQLINVLRGDISLVGPRPIVESELERYGESGGKFLAIKPGLTGLWQVSGRNDIGYDERVKLDIYYVENWSLWLDIAILWRTLGVVLHGRGY